MRIVHNRIFTVAKPVFDIEQHLVSVSLHKELGETQHPFTRRRPIAAFHLHDVP